MSVYFYYLQYGISVTDHYTMYITVGNVLLGIILHVLHHSSYSHTYLEQFYGSYYYSVGSLEIENLVPK